MERGIMDMVQAYQGYFQAGRFVSREKTAIPDNVEVVVVVTDKTMTTQAKTFDEQEIAKRRKAVQSLKGIMAGHDADLAQIREERLSRRGLL